MLLDASEYGLDIPAVSFPQGRPEIIRVFIIIDGSQGQIPTATLPVLSVAIRTNKEIGFPYHVLPYLLEWGFCMLHGVTSVHLLSSVYQVLVLLVLINAIQLSEIRAAEITS